MEVPFRAADNYPAASWRYAFSDRGRLARRTFESCNFGRRILLTLHATARPNPPKLQHQNDRNSDMELKTRRVYFAGCTTSPHEAWMRQAARELTNCEDGFLNGKQRLIIDRDTKFCESFRSLLSNEGVKSVRLPSRAPNMNSHMERFFGSLKSECLHRLILFGENMTRNSVRQYLVHYHTERCHQGLDNSLIEPFEQQPDV